MRGNEKMSTRNMSYCEILTQGEGVKGDSKLLSLDGGNTDTPLFTVNITAGEDSGSCCL